MLGGVSDSRIDALEATCISVGVRVEYRPLGGGLRGYYQHAERLIAIDRAFQRCIRERR